MRTLEASANVCRISISARNTQVLLKVAINENVAPRMFKASMLG